MKPLTVSVGSLVVSKESARVYQIVAIDAQNDLAKVKEVNGLWSADYVTEWYLSGIIDTEFEPFTPPPPPKARFIQMLTVPDGYNGHVCTGAVLWDYVGRTLVFAYTHGFHSISQQQLDHYRSMNLVSSL